VFSNYISLSWHQKATSKKGKIDMTRFLPTVAAVALMASSTIMFAPAAHADAQTEFAVKLTYNTADLTSMDGASTVLRKLERQARTACMTVKPIIQTESVDQACVAEVLTEAVNQIQSPTLTSAFRQMDGYDQIALASDADPRS
jgi:UrcA family protein